MCEIDVDEKKNQGGGEGSKDERVAPDHLECRTVVVGAYVDSSYSQQQPKYPKHSQGKVKMLR
jgi:hypothetical protein